VFSGCFGLCSWADGRAGPQAGQSGASIPPYHELSSVGRVVEIRYLYVAGENGSLYQPVYLGERDEIDADDCTLERQRLKRKPAA